MKKFKLSLYIALLILPSLSYSQAILEADGVGNTYELINSILAPGYEAVENPECIHPEFGRHIAEVWDTDLSKYVFEFYIHVTPDNDRCINLDRQRVEIKTYEPSPANLKGTSGETVVYKWRFKIPTGFQPSSNFTHIHQVKAVGGDDDDPIFVLTARKGTPNKLELNYYSNSDSSQQKLTSADLSLFENTWVEATERIKVHNTNGAYTISVKNLKTGSVIMSYTNSKLLTIRADNDFIRPKWGIYRSLLSSSDLRDESIRFSYFSISEDTSTAVNQQINSDQQSLTTCFDESHNKIKVSYEIKNQSNSSLYISSIDGKRIKYFCENTNQPAGQYSTDIDYQSISSGVYILSLKTNQEIISKKLIIKK